GLIVHEDARQAGILGELENAIVWWCVADWWSVRVALNDFGEPGVKIFWGFAGGESCKTIVAVFDWNIWHWLTHFGGLPGSSSIPPPT
ncbi:unnamed protein product, partial [marine sediment metagenome]